MKRIAAVALAMGLMVGCEPTADKPAETAVPAHDPAAYMKQMQGNMKGPEDAPPGTAPAVGGEAAPTTETPPTTDAAPPTTDAAPATTDAAPPTTDAAPPANP